jgi:hypothetical protein
MALGLTTETSSFERIPYIKYNGKSGRIERVDRKQSATGDWVSEDTEITNNFRAVFDMENIEVGWISFDGQPDFRMAKLGQPRPEKPAGKYKNGFRVRLKLDRTISLNPEGDIRELSGNATVANTAMNELHDAYVAGVKEHPGMLPIVVMTGASKITSSYKDENGKQATSVSYQPVWKIEKWTARPAAFDAAPTATPEPAPVAAPVEADDTEF